MNCPSCGASGEGECEYCGSTIKNPIPNIPNSNSGGPTYIYIDNSTNINKITNNVNGNNNHVQSNYSADRNSIMGKAARPVNHRFVAWEIPPVDYDAFIILGLFIVTIVSIGLIGSSNNNAFRIAAENDDMVRKQIKEKEIENKVIRMQKEGDEKLFRRYEARVVSSHPDTSGMANGSFPYWVRPTDFQEMDRIKEQTRLFVKDANAFFALRSEIHIRRMELFSREEYNSEYKKLFELENQLSTIDYDYYKELTGLPFHWVRHQTGR